MATRPEQTVAPSTWNGRLRLVGPGIVLALSSVGASDMITTMNSGAEYGLALAWAFTVGIILKFVLSDAVTRLQLSGDRSFMSHLTDVGGRAFPAVLLLAELLVGLFFGASVVSVCTLILQALFPVLPFWPTGIVVLASAVGVLWMGRYSLLEKAMMGFGMLMFVGIVSLAVTLLGEDSARAVAAETTAPVLPDNSIVAVLSLIGGVGGATGIMAYTFWIREKAWRGPKWKSTVRLDLSISYAAVLLFAVAMTMVGAFTLYGEGFTIADNDAMFTMAGMLGTQFGNVLEVLFLVSFLAVVYTSVLGGLSGIAYVTSDCLRVLRHYPHQDDDAKGLSTSSAEFRGALIYLSACALLIMGTGRPVTLVLIYAAISACILPVLAVALLLLLNRRSMQPDLRNGIVSNVLLIVCLVLFGFLAVLQISESLGSLTG